MSNGPKKIRDFAQLIPMLRWGEAQAELDADIAEVISQVRKTGKPGSVALTITIKPDGERQLEITDKIVTKIPQPTADKTRVFDTTEGYVTQTDPLQPDLEGLREVETPEPEPLRDVASE